MQSPEQFEKEQELVKHWKPPNNHRVFFKVRVFELERWIERQGFVEENDILNYAMKRFNVEREQARVYLVEVIKDFERLGIPVIKQ